MADELPEDCRDWPEDAFALLGVPRGADDATIRRSYTKLIRRFKPEHFPEQFQRIRDAYETCQQQANWYRDEPVYEVAAEPAAELPQWSAPRRNEEPDEVERFWTRAIDGDLAEAYTGLANLQEKLERPDLPLRLYWLLALDPKLDAARSRYDWLAEALIRGRLRGSAVELYRRELELEPALAVGGPFRNLLAQPAKLDDLLTVARIRIAAAGKTEQFLVIENDLRSVKQQLALDGDAGWMSLLIAANDWAAWGAPADLSAYCRAEFAALKHLELHHSYFFDRIEEAEKVGSDCRALHWAGEGMPEEFIRIVHANWAGGGTVCPAELAAGIAPLAAEPAAFLERFDRQIRKRGTGFAVQALSLLERHYRNREPEYPPDLIRGVAHAQISINMIYENHRGTILMLLLQECIHPEEFAEALAADPQKRLRTFAESMRDDRSLRIVWLASVLHPSSM